MKKLISIMALSLSITGCTSIGHNKTTQSSEGDSVVVIGYFTIYLMIEADVCHNLDAFVGKMNKFC
jgi:hypothetical protein